MASGSRGWNWSKQAVRCDHCGKEGRRDNIESHIQKDHPNKEIKVSVIKPKDAGDISLFFQKKKEPPVVSDPVIDVDLDRVVEQPFDDLYDTEMIDDINSNRKRSQTTSADTVSAKFRKFEDDMDEKLSRMRDSIVNEVGKTFESSLKKIIDLNANESFVVDTDQNEDENKTIDQIMKSRDLETFEKIVAKLQFIKREISADEKSFYCGVCYDDSPPSFTAQDKSKPGCFLINCSDYKKDILEGDGSVPRSLRNIKSHIKSHVINSKVHINKQKEKKKLLKQHLEYEARNRKVGLNIFRLRYSGLRQHKPRSSFENDLLTAKLNGTDVGDINHSRFFVKDLDTAIYEQMKEDIKKHLGKKLTATERKRPVGMVMDKMTPSKRTGQIHALIVPVPENSLSQPLLVPLCLEVPPVTELHAAGLASLSKSVLNNAGAEDFQLEGIGVDGEYVKKGFKEKLLEILEIPEFTLEEKAEWFTMVWEPAHELELAVKDVRKDGVFDWLDKHIKLINEATELLNIGKGLQQSIEAATEIDEKLYKLRNLSDTRFVAYFGDCLRNNEKSLKISIIVLDEKAADRATKKDTRDKAARILNHWKTQQWMILNLGLIDIFTLLGVFSKSLQKVEQFPWEIRKTQRQLINALRKMADMRLTDEAGEVFEANFDKDLWVKLVADIENVLSGEYKGQDTQVFQVFRRGRTSDDIRKASNSLLVTVQNRLSSLCSAIAKSLEERLENEETHCSTKLIDKMGECLDISKMLDNSIEDVDGSETERSLKVLEELLVVAKYCDDGVKEVKEQYVMFRDRLHDLGLGGDDAHDLIKMHEHLLYMEHKCSDQCTAKSKKTCNDSGKLIMPRVPVPVKFLQLFLKERILFQGIESFLHFFLRCIVKTHAEGVAESMGNYIDLHSDKRRGMEIDDVGKEALIHWNGPPVHLADNLGINSLNRKFSGTHWNFTTRNPQPDSTVITRLKKENEKLKGWF